jgi:hypothetical protein
MIPKSDADGKLPNFPYLYSNIPSSSPYGGVYISQPERIQQTTWFFGLFFFTLGRLLTKTLMLQECFTDLNTYDDIGQLVEIENFSWKWELIATIGFYAYFDSLIYPR